MIDYPHGTTDNLVQVGESIRRTRLAVNRPGGSVTDPGFDEKGRTPYEYSIDKAVQSIAQTTAIVIQDAADMMRNVSTEEVTAIGVATAKWIVQPEMVVYETIINQSMQVIENSAAAYLALGKAAYQVLEQFKST